MFQLSATLASPGPELIKIGPIIFRWYGFLIAIAVLIGLNLSNYLAKLRGIKNNLISDLLPILVISSIIGARLYYVLFQWNNYENDLISIFSIWRGGIAIHGALIGGVISLIYFCRWNKQAFWNLLDILLPSVALGQAIGRWGNFFNNEAFGVPTNLPWKLFIPISYRPQEFMNFNFFHPTFLYESIWDFGVFLVLITLLYIQSERPKALRYGACSCFYMIFYSLGRVWIEGLRTDALCIAGIPPLCEGGIRVAQLVSISLIGAGLIGLWRLYVAKKNLPELGLPMERNK